VSGWIGELRVVAVACRRNLALRQRFNLLKRISSPVWIGCAAFSGGTGQTNFLIWRNRTYGCVRQVQKFATVRSGTEQGGQTNFGEAFLIIRYASACSFAPWPALWLKTPPSPLPTLHPSFEAVFANLWFLHLALNQARSWGTSSCARYSAREVWGKSGKRRRSRSHGWSP
jgi:hypothetical protein